MPARSRSRIWFALIGFIGAAFAAGAIGARATFENVETWYPTLNKPSWQPPNWIFGPMWTTLYGLMGFAVWRVWKRSEELRIGAARRVVKVYFIHLIFNAAWSVLFFGLKQPSWALVDIVVLWLMLAWLQLRLLRLDLPAAIAWLPYLLWVSFASALNFAIVRLN